MLNEDNDVIAQAEGARAARANKLDEKRFELDAKLKELGHKKANDKLMPFHYKPVIEEVMTMPKKEDVATEIVMGWIREEARAIKLAEQQRQAQAAAERQARVEAKRKEKRRQALWLKLKSHLRGSSPSQQYKAAMQQIKAIEQQVRELKSKGETPEVIKSQIKEHLRSLLDAIKILGGDEDEANAKRIIRKWFAEGPQ